MISIIITDESGEQIPPVEFNDIQQAIEWLNHQAGVEYEKEQRATHWSEANE